jgi:lysyl-tRNA synthetase class 2
LKLGRPLPVTTTIAAVRAAYRNLEPDVVTMHTVGIAGRVTSQSDNGKLCFATLRADDGTEIQAMLELQRLGEDELAAWKNSVGIGDEVFVSGEVITTKRGVLSVMADEWRMAAKALRPLPVAANGGPLGSAGRPPSAEQQAS